MDRTFAQSASIQRSSQAELSHQITTLDRQQCCPSMCVARLTSSKSCATSAFGVSIPTLLYRISHFCCAKLLHLPAFTQNLGL